MAEPPRAPPVSTFVVRFWREWSPTAPRWRGRIEHVQSGQRADFVCLEDMVTFVRASGAMAEEQGGPTKASERESSCPL